MSLLIFNFCGHDKLGRVSQRSTKANLWRLSVQNLLWPPYVIGGPLYFCPVVSFYLSFFFFLAYSQRPQSGCLPYFYTWRGSSANLECRSKRRCTRLAANAGPKEVAKNRHLGTIAQLCRAICSQLWHVSTIGKKLVKQQYLLYMSPQYGELRPTSG